MWQSASPRDDICKVPAQQRGHMIFPMVIHYQISRQIESHTCLNRNTNAPDHNNHSLRGLFVPVSGSNALHTLMSVAHNLILRTPLLFLLDPGSVTNLTKVTQQVYSGAGLQTWAFITPDLSSLVTGLFLLLPDQHRDVG